MLEARIRQEAHFLRYQQRTGKNDGEKSGMSKQYDLNTLCIALWDKE